MNGQWLGRYAGDNSGEITINIDRVDNHFECVTYLRPDSAELPTSIAYFKTQNGDDEQTTKAYVNLIDPQTHKETSWDQIKHRFDGDEHSSDAEVKLSIHDGKLNLSAETDICIKLTAELQKSDTSGASKIEGTKMSWTEYKSHLSSLPRSSFLFRGQQKPWSLCTSFHRRERYRINEFLRTDMPQLHRRLAAITSHLFDLAVPDQNGAFVNLLQHHGYPTPLLDWSHSPYVAAFFAFRSRPIGYEGDEVVRIYLFNNKAWQNRYPQIAVLDPPFPHLSVLEFIALDNSRLVPQQSVTTVSNVHDIEAYVLRMENSSGEKFLEAIDIPANEREEVMGDLRFMGITAGSMFPGVDGVCEEVRERNFEQ